MRSRRPKPAVGETWFARLPRAVGAQLVAVTIDEFTPATVVLILREDGQVGYEGHLGRYIRREVKFVERVPESFGATEEGKTASAVAQVLSIKAAGAVIHHD
jgi:hypothetical protein